VNADFDLKTTLDFLKALKRHNNRDWFESHRPQYQAARSDFEAFVTALIQELAPVEGLGGLSAKDCIFRLNRDLRFSKDKSPYKTHMSAYIAPGGRKSRSLGYYVHVSPGDQSMIAGGMHEPEPQQLASWRQTIDRDPGPFNRIIHERTFRRYFGEVSGEKLKTAPKGYPRDHPQLELLRLKQVTAMRPIPDKDLLGRSLLQETLRTFRAMKPFLRYLENLG
jgi:uncharacterized protein (TIGR02453 family)